jgi:hypothetical protein
MIGRFIQQQYVWLNKQQGCQATRIRQPDSVEIGVLHGGKLQSDKIMATRASAESAPRSVTA